MFDHFSTLHLKGLLFAANQMTVFSKNHSFSTFAPYAPLYAHVYMRVRGLEVIVFRKI